MNLDEKWRALREAEQEYARCLVETQGLSDEDWIDLAIDSIRAGDEAFGGSRLAVHILDLNERLKKIEAMLEDEGAGAINAWGLGAVKLSTERSDA